MTTEQEENFNDVVEDAVKASLPIYRSAWSIEDMEVINNQLNVEVAKEISDGNFRDPTFYELVHFQKELNQYFANHFCTIRCAIPRKGDVLLHFLAE